VEGIRSRALERELVREERVLERQRIRDERAAVQSRQDSVRRGRQEAKEAQLRQWRLEVDAHNQRDEDLLRLGNESPEVEDREQLYEELRRERPYQPPDYEPPAVPDTEAVAIREAHAARFEARLADFALPARTTDTVQLGAGLAGTILAVAAMSPRVTAMPAWLGAGCIGLWLLLESRRRAHWEKSFVTASSSIRAEVDAAISGELETRRLALDASARAEHERRVQMERDNHERDQQERRAHLDALRAGELRAMEREAKQMFPLDDAAAWAATATIRSRSAATVEIAVPLEQVMQISAGTLLKSGKPSYKKKTQKRFREECERVVAGIALRHASELMLLLPTIQEVEVRCGWPRKDESTGRDHLQLLLTVTYVFQTLAPLQMADIDPHAALKHFQHQDAVRDAASAIWSRASA